MNRLKLLISWAKTEKSGATLITRPNSYTGALIVGIARWSVPRIGQGHLEAVSSVVCQYNIH